MSEITIDEVRRIAALAKLAITDEEAKKFTKELDEILGYFRKLESVDTTGLQPTYQVNGLSNATRKDEIVDYGSSHDDLMGNAPKVHDGQIEVPKVL